jgi:DNA-binding FrmR family transcriptional regulator
MPTRKETKKQASKMVKQSIGTLNKVLEMIENDVYCFDVIQQLESVDGMNKKAVQILLKKHLETCIVEKIQAGGEGQAEAVDELLKMYGSK